MKIIIFLPGPESMRLALARGVAPGTSCKSLKRNKNCPLCSRRDRCLGSGMWIALGKTETGNAAFAGEEAGHGKPV